MHGSKTFSRKRGIRASRRKLTEALIAKGLRTQTRLAELIADLEALDTPPVKMVNRVFSEHSVEVQTLARVARALDVEAHTLYKTTDEEGADEKGTAGPATPSHSISAPIHNDTHESPATEPRSTLPRTWITASLMSGIIFLVLWLFPRHASETSVDSASQQPIQTLLSLGQSRIAVLPFKNDQNDTLTGSLRMRLDSEFAVASKTAIAVLQSGDANDAIETLRVDAVIEGDITTVGLYNGVRVYMLANGVRKPIWAESMLASQLSDQLPSICDNISNAVAQAFSPSQKGNDKLFFPSASAQDDFLEAQLHLHNDSSELNIKRAQSRFSSAVRKEPTYARAHAGLCLALLEEFWMSDEQRALDDAAGTCGEAIRLAPDDSVVLQAQALFLRRSGRNTEALALYQSLIEREPGNPLALESMASSLLDAYRQSGEQHYLNSAISSAKQAHSANPELIEPLTTLVVLEWFAGNISGAIEASVAAIAIEETSGALVNLGTMYLCMGEFGEALTTYQRASELSPESNKNAEFEGQAHYFMGDFERSANMRKSAIDSIATGSPEVHEMWGNLGDSYRQLDDRDNAMDAYLQAARIVERDDLRGNNAIADRIARGYYYTMMHKFDKDSVPASVMSTIDAELDDMAAAVTETSALRRLTQIWLEKGNIEKAKASLKTVSATCPGYVRIPDFQPLADEGSQ